MLQLNKTHNIVPLVLLFRMRPLLCLSHAPIFGKSHFSLPPILILPLASCLFDRSLIQPQLGGSRVFSHVTVVLRELYMFQECALVTWYQT